MNAGCSKAIPIFKNYPRRERVLKTLETFGPVGVDVLRILLGLTRSQVWKILKSLESHCQAQVITKKKVSYWGVNSGKEVK